ncbi:MAG: haloacid dehalogenase-like hydrolase, partial [Gammaproteobacteria bacterium]
MITSKPLVVDLDGTLIKSDTLFESLFGFIKQYPGRFYQPLVWLLRGGKATMKSHLIRRVHITAEHLPYDETVLHWLRTEKASGRKLILATASHKHYADQIAEHLQLFDEVIATTDVNLAAKNKTNVLIEQFGEKGFDYVGNSMDDIHVWQAANYAIIVNPELGVERRAKKLGNVEKIINSNPPPLVPWIKALRFHQWLKNLLIFVPLLASHQ